VTTQLQLIITIIIILHARDIKYHVGKLWHKENKNFGTDNFCNIVPDLYIALFSKVQKQMKDGI